MRIVDGSGTNAREEGKNEDISSMNRARSIRNWQQTIE
jgi:hypothetical protein